MILCLPKVLNDIYTKINLLFKFKDVRIHIINTTQYSSE